MPDGASGFTVKDETNIRPPEFSDDGLALSFSTRYAGNSLYVPSLVEMAAVGWDPLGSRRHPACVRPSSRPLPRIRGACLECAPEKG